MKLMGVEDDLLVPPIQQILSLVRIHDTDNLQKCAIECAIGPVTRTPSSAERWLIGEDKTDLKGINELMVSPLRPKM